MYLECTGPSDARLTAILADGRGLVTADSWALVQQDVSMSIRICSYDAIGAGRSDKVQESHSIDQVVSEMHDLFETAHLRKPYVLVGISAGGVLIRRYQQQYPGEVGGLVFVDSSHEEMQWRDAAIAPQMDPDWNNPSSLRNDGFFLIEENSHGTQIFHSLFWSAQRRFHRRHFQPYPTADQWHQRSLA